MKTFGFKAFIRAIAIFASVYLVKIAIGVIPQINDTFVKIIFVIGILIAILLINIAPGIIPSTRRNNSDKDGNAEK